MNIISANDSLGATENNSPYIHTHNCNYASLQPIIEVELQIKKTIHYISVIVAPEQEQQAIFPSNKARMSITNTRKYFSVDFRSALHSLIVDGFPKTGTTYRLKSIPSARRLSRRCLLFIHIYSEFHSKHTHALAFNAE